MPWRIRITRLCYRWAYTFLRLYWVLARPNVYGVKCVLCWNRHVLLIRHTYGYQSWTVPGGGIARGETPEEAARREIHEEVGITLPSVRYLGQFVLTHDCVQDHVTVFSATVPSPGITLDPVEILEARWFPAEALPPVSDITRQVLRLWQQHGKDA